MKKPADVPPAELELELLPEAARLEAAPLVGRFRNEQLSGHVTIVLHFLDGRSMPSDVGALVRRVGSGERRATKPMLAPDDFSD